MIDQEVISAKRPTFPRNDAVVASDAHPWSRGLDLSQSTAIIVVDEIHALGSFCLRQIKNHFPRFFRNVIFVGGQPPLTSAFFDEDCRPLPRLLTQYVRECRSRLELPASFVIRTGHDPLQATY